MFAQPTWLPGLGEEFAVLLEAASIEGAQVWAERFRQDTAATAVVWRGVDQL